MADNKFYIFDENSTNVMGDVDYATDAQRLSGVTPGQARSILHNKLFRQVSIMASAIGQIVADAGKDANDSSIATLITNVKYAFTRAASITYNNSTTQIDATTIQQVVDKANTSKLTTIAVANWTPTPPYTQTISVAGVKARDKPMIAIVPNDDTAIDDEQNFCWDMVSKIKTSEGAITVICNKWLPTVDLPIEIRGY